jgi:predicted ATPase
MRLTHLKINGEERLLANVNFIIGPNSSGKTRFLDDLNTIAITENDHGGDESFFSKADGTSLVELSDDRFEITDEEAQDWANHFEIYLKDGKAGKERLGHKQGQELAAPFDSRLMEDVLPWLIGKASPSSPLYSLKQNSTTILRVDDRLSRIKSADNIDPAGDDTAFLNRLALSYEWLRRLNKELLPLLKRRLVLLKIADRQLALYLVDGGTVDPEWGDTNHPATNKDVMAKHRRYADEYKAVPISSASHGTRAIIDIIAAVLDPLRKVVLIDEPELFTYPAANKHITRLIADLSSEKQFFIVTHEPEILEIMAASGKDFTIIRLSDYRTINLTLIDANDRLQIASELKNSGALRAGFYDSVLFVEGINDKYLYGGVITRERMIPVDTEFGIVECGGDGKVADHTHFALKVGTRCAVAVDFDALYEMKDKHSIVSGILNSLGATDTSLLEDVEAIGATIRTLTSGFKKRGIHASSQIPNDIKIAINSIISRLDLVGIFVVPIGELFDWFDSQKKEDDGTLIPVESLLDKYTKDASAYPDVKNYLSRICNHLMGK